MKHGWQTDDFMSVGLLITSSSDEEICINDNNITAAVVTGDRLKQFNMKILKN